MFHKLNSTLEKSTDETIDECTRLNLHYIGLLLSLKHNNDKTQYFRDAINSSNEDGKVITEEIDTSTDIENKLLSTKLPKDSKIIIKLMGNWTSSENLCKTWDKMSKGDFTWNNITLSWDNPNPDYYVIINSPPKGEIINPKRTIVFRMEPFMEKNKEQWGFWSSPDPKHFLKICYHSKDYNNIEWHLGKTYEELKSLDITKKDKDVVSTVLSTKYSDPGHIKRIDFVKFMETKDFEIHTFGADNKYKNYKGTLPYHCKDDAMFPYKYSFNCENNNIENYFTEKLIDGILAGCLVFYSGHPSVKNYIDERAFVYLELEDFEKDFETIQLAIKEDWWSERLPYIKSMRDKILDELQFFPRLEKIITSLNT
jgi:hypothetical protein